MRISLIVAMASNRVIGIHNRLPWHLPADLKRFRAITMGKSLLMGRKTYESIGRPLPGRTSLVLTTDRSYRPDGCIVVHTLADALARAGDVPELMVIGGASLYQAMLPCASRLYLTVLDRDFDGDVFFPAHDPALWRETERLDITDDPGFSGRYSFLVLDRIAEGSASRRAADPSAIP